MLSLCSCEIKMRPFRDPSTPEFLQEITGVRTHVCVKGYFLRILFRVVSTLRRGKIRL